LSLFKTFAADKLFSCTGAEQVGAIRSDPFDVGARKTEVRSLKSFLDEDTPKFLEIAPQTLQPHGLQ
jgi:hypothetical protein